MLKTLVVGALMLGLAGAVPAAAEKGHKKPRAVQTEQGGTIGTARPAGNGAAFGGNAALGGNNANSAQGSNASQNIKGGDGGVSQ